MTRDARFWRNLTIVGLIHLAILLGLIWWSRAPRRPTDNVIWMEGGTGPAAPADEAPPASTPEPTSESTPEPSVDEPTPEAMPSAKSEIEMPSPSISPTPTPTATPTPTLTPTPTPKPTPKPTPRPTPRPTPKHTPKPSPSPKRKEPKTTPEEKNSKTEEESERKKKVAKSAPGKGTESTDKPVKKATAADEGEGEEPKAKGTGGSGGKAKGEGGASEFGWYANMLHDRFYSEWVQPTSVVHTAPLSVLLRIRIDRDGRISNYEIAKSSGNPVVDDSVTEAAARVKQVDPLPKGLGGDYYDVNINFELQ